MSLTAYYNYLLPSQNSQGADLTGFTLVACERVAFQARNDISINFTI
jgi:hypothetical protein